MKIKPELTIEDLYKEVKVFCFKESNHQEPSLYGINDGKAVGTYLEHKFQNYLEEKYTYVKGNSARGIDFPDLLVDLKVTSIKQPQSSCPFKSARQKIFGLGYSLLIFVYDKIDNHVIGYLTISNALQWRLQYSRVIEKANQVDGILRIN